MVQFLSINVFLGFLQFLLGFSKVPVFFCVTLYSKKFITMHGHTNVKSYDCVVLLNRS